jgi:YHS domain-containing protein
MKFKLLAIPLVLLLAAGVFVFAQEKAEKPASDDRAGATESTAVAPATAPAPAPATAPATAPTTRSAAIFNKKCPISGDAVDPKAQTFTYKGKKIGFCCPDCIDAFKKNPEKYMKGLK